MPLSREEVFNRVRKVIVEELGVTDAQVTEESTFEHDLGADSLDVVELVMAFEEEFNIDIPDEDVGTLKTVGQVVDYVHAKAP